MSPIEDHYYHAHIEPVLESILDEARADRQVILRHAYVSTTLYDPTPVTQELMANDLLTSLITKRLLAVN